MKVLTIDIPVGTVLPAKVVVTIPDPIVTQPDPSFVIVPGGTTKPISLPVIPFSDPDFLRPMADCRMFFNAIQAVPVPTDANPVALDNYKGFLWSAMQTVNGVYNWATFDSMMNGSIDRGQKVSFTIGMISNVAADGAIPIGAGFAGYPQFVHDAMQAETVKDWIPSGGCAPGNMWVPNWNSLSLMGFWQTFLKALYQHIINTVYKNVKYQDAISLVNIGGYGIYAEWQTACAGRDNPNLGARKATAQTLNNFIDAYRLVFDLWPLSLPINVFAGTGNGEVPSETGYYGLTKNSAWGPIGWASFHLGTNEDYAKYDVDKNTNSYNGVPFKPLLLDRYKTAPISGEPMNSEATQTTNGVQFALIEAQVREYGVTYFSNSFNYKVPALDATGLQNFRNACKAAGFRLQVNGGSVTGNVLTLNWGNVGIAPIYENWQVWFEIRQGATVVWSGQSSFVPKYFLPGTKTVVDTIGNFTGDLYLIIKDPTGYRKPLPLANTGRAADGSYKLVTL